MSESRHNLWAPWRIDYIRGLDKTERPPARASGCFLCDAAGVAGDSGDEKKRREQLVLLSDSRGVLMMNRYPYTNGHLLAAPSNHLADLSDMTALERAGLMELGELGSRLLRRAMNAQGVNLGMNLGRCAGAGLPGHAHLHIVPRWEGDVNFMEVTGQVRVIPQALTDSYLAMLAALQDEDA